MRGRRRNPNGFWAWASEHWFLTFLLASSAISIPVAIAQAVAKAGAGPVFGAGTLAEGLQPGDLVVVNASRGQVPGFALPNILVRVTALHNLTFSAALVSNCDASNPLLQAFQGAVGEFAITDVTAKACS